MQVVDWPRPDTKSRTQTIFGKVLYWTTVDDLCSISASDIVLYLEVKHDGIFPLIIFTKINTWGKLVAWSRCSILVKWRPDNVNAKQKIKKKKTKKTEATDLMPDKRAGSWRGMWPGRDVAAYAKSVFSMQFSVTFTFLFSQHSKLLSSKNIEPATYFSFLCMPTTVSGSNSLSFAIIGDQSLEVWQRSLRMTGDTDKAKSSKLFFPSFFFFCLLQSLESFLSLLEKIPKGDLAISKTYPEPELFLSILLGRQTCLLFVCELVSIRLSDSKWGNSPSAKVKPVED